MVLNAGNFIQKSRASNLRSKKDHMTQNKPQSSTTIRDELLTIDEVADRLKVTTRTVRSLVYDGELDALRIGRRRMVRIQASDVDKLLVKIRTAGSWDV